MPLSLNSRLGPYRIDNLLGSGGMGAVYGAYDVRLQRPVALKVLRGVDGAGDRRRLLQEARAASSLNHPNIVTVYDVGEQDGFDYIAMELIDGESLARVLGRGPIDVRRAIRYAAEVAGALARAHAAGIIHRDLKPANLMLTRDDRVKVLDFGVAKLTQKPLAPDAPTQTTPVTYAGAIVGTAEYMSPEQAQGQAIDARSDVFALGVVLQEMLTARSPFRRASTLDTLFAIVHEAPAGLDSDARPDVPPELMRIITRCLRKEPDRRFQSMADLSVALQEVADELDGSRSDRRARVPLRWLAALAAAALFALVAGVAVATRWSNRPRAASGAVSVARLTFDDGLQTQPAWSPNGQLLAYTADRDGNFDIYVQQVDGGNAVKVTASAATDWQPDWSPDGTRIVFRSERERGGLFVVGALGGQEQRLTNFGYRPRWSPDGQRVMFVSSAMPISEVPEVYVVESGLNQQPRQILSQVFRDFRLVWSVQWHPTRNVVTFLGRKEALGWDLWHAAIDDATPTKFEIPDSVKAQIVVVGSALWAPDGASVYLEGTSAGVTNLYVVDASVDRPREVGTPRMLTSGLNDSDMAISKDGRHIAYTRRQERNRIWKLPLDSKGHDTIEGGRPLTDAAVHALLSDVSADGSRLAFIGFRDGQSKQELWSATLSNGEPRPVFVDDFRRLPLRWSRDGQRLAYRRSSYDATRTRGEHAMVVLGAAGTEDQLTSPVHDTFDMPYDWSADGQWILGGTNRLTGQALIARYPIAAAPAAEQKLEVIARCADCDLWQARYGPGDAWIAFTRVSPNGGESVINLVRASGGSWVPVTEAGRWADKPRWAPQRSLLFYISNRMTGTFNVWAQAINSNNGTPDGVPIVVTRFSGPRVMINPLLASVELSVTTDGIVLPVMEVSGNIWLLARTLE